jgi:AraC-like DNA-binding protein
VFQLYPFVLKSFFHVQPQALNDDCYNLEQLKYTDMAGFIKQIKSLKTVSAKTAHITALLYQLFQTKKQVLDFKVKQVIEFILKTKGQQSISNLATDLKLNERTLERRFLNEVGLSPKQFSKIIQFQLSLEQLTMKDYTKLTDIVYENGFADQSHFIKVFKAFTGKTPKTFKMPQ